MLVAEQKRIRDRRNAKAETMRTLRGAGCPAAAVRELGRIQHGNPPRVQPETLGDYWPILPGTGTCNRGVLAVISGNAESWTTVFLIPAEWTDEDIRDRLGICEHYGGPGRGFASMPCVQRNRFHTLVHWSGGLDI